MGCHFNFLAHVPLKLLVSLISRLVACSARIVADRHTHRPTTVTLAAHARRGLIRETFQIENAVGTFVFCLGSLRSELPRYVVRPTEKKRRLLMSQKLFFPLETSNLYRELTIVAHSILRTRPSV